jgi:hypothetical protein
MAAYRTRRGLLNFRIGSAEPRVTEGLGEPIKQYTQWIARVLRNGRDSVSTSNANASNPMICTACGTPMNQHAEKVDFFSTGDPVFYGTVQQVHQCAGCSNVQVRRDDAAQ